MDVADGMISFYLGNLTASYFDHHDEPADRVDDYRDSVEEMKKQALYHGDLDALRLGIEHLLAHPDLDIRLLSRATHCPYELEQLWELLRFARQEIWPDAGSIPPGGPSDVRLVPMSVKDWWAARGHRPAPRPPR